MKRMYAYSDRKLVQSDAEGCPVIVFFNPDPGDKQYLINDLKLDEHTLQSALDPHELARLEFEPEHLASIFKRPHNYSAKDHYLFKTASVGAFLFKDKLVIVLNEEVPLFDGLIFNRQPSPLLIFLKLIYRSISHFFEHLQIISSISDELQTKINKSMENRHLFSLFTLQKSLVYYLNSINTNGVLLDKLHLNAAKIGFASDELELLEDTLIENNQCYRQAEIYSNILAGLMDARASIVSNNLNVLMKTLNIITIAIMVPTFVVSAFSMNVSIPLEKHPLAFYMILGLALLSVLGFILFWQHKKW